MANRLLTLLVAFSLAGCGSGVFDLLGGGGPNVAANTQIGKENRQAVFSSEAGATAGRDVVTKEVDAQQVEAVTINNDRVPIWLIVALVLGWLAPSPNEIGRGVRGLFSWRK